MKRSFAAAAVFIAAAVFLPSAGGKNILLAKDSGTHHDKGLDHWEAPRSAAETPNPVPADSASLERGEKIYRANCAPCHGTSGRGDGPAAAALTPKPADLVHSAEEHSAGDLAWKIANGRPPMPPWKKILSESHIWDVVNYIGSLSGEGRRHGGRDE